MLAKWREASGKKDWYRVLPRMYEIYNTSTHSTIKAKPNDVWDGKDTNKQTITVIQDQLKPGDKVRIRMTKKVFQKGDAIKFSREIYTIKEKKGKKWVIVDDKDKPLSRRYSEDELRLANRVDKAEIQVPNKNKVLNEQEEEIKQERKVKKVKTELGNVGAKSKFDKGLESISGKRKR